MTHPQEQRRKQAIVRYLAGEKIEAICRDLHCSKSWLYKWKARYQADDPEWAKGLSTQPRHKPSQLPQRIATACRRVAPDLGHNAANRERCGYPAGAPTTRDQADSLSANDLSYLATP